MRIFDQLRKPGASVNLVADAKTDILWRVPTSLCEAIEGAVRVVADDCGSWFWKSERDVWNYQDHFGPLRLPYPEMWIEWKIPSRIFVNGWADAYPLEATGSLVVEDPPSEEAPKGTYRTLNITWVQRGAGSLAMWPAFHLVHVDEAGNFLSGHCVSANPDLATYLSDRYPMFQPALLAVGLMNCKNVQVKEETPPPKLARATHKRHGVTPLRYNVISLPGNPSVRSNAEAKLAAGPAMPLHLVRGHFKTYTAERPLLGQHTGTYWWGWQTRGNKSSGEVQKHYRVGPRGGLA